jgi:tetratricopeptide (TPR) repeat protein
LDALAPPIGGRDRQLPRALTWALDAAHADLALALAAALQEFWPVTWRPEEAHRWLTRALSLDHPASSPSARARALLARSRQPHFDPRRSADDARAALALYRRLDDPAGECQSLVTLGHNAVVRGRHEQATTLADQALERARALSDDRLIAAALKLKVMSSTSAEATGANTAEALAHLRRTGATRSIGRLLTTSSYLAIAEARYAQAIALVDEALALARAAEDRQGIAVNRGNEGLAALGLGDDRRAAAAFADQLRLCRALAFFEPIYEGLIGLAAVTARRGALHESALLAGAGDAAFQRLAHYPADECVIERIRAERLEPARKAAPEAWDTAARDGRGLDDREAIAAALRTAQA